MDIRNAAIEDIEAIRSVARESLAASYGHVIDDETIDAAIEEWYSEDALEETLVDDESTFVLAVDDGGPIGFAQSDLITGREAIGYIDWLHVGPDHRGVGIGSQLLSRLRQALMNAGADRLEGRVLTENETGLGFYEDQGFSVAGKRTVSINDEIFTERIYSLFVDSAEEPAANRQETEAGDTVYIAYDETVRGSEAPFFAAYLDEDHEERYGWFCGADESLDVAMDTMERIECTACGNQRRPVRWDAAYL
ncbi:GNAT family N-acetyltransferase [Haloquadratum walsbyi]|jgi:Acetyltransferases|uniref:Acetyltransferase n=1 Tax=Haloquadratum walsbyi J07HQW2 TaxID=1238425 RepID=U1N1B3_9EURY|nr:GNAT family N-acetyltransferase [Haloquadratum walsbyi]ERG96639.1 MAG: acetyltransferase [Haloquadratum walsbyi J07HQW2]